jgi:hypothetical protein
MAPSRGIAPQEDLPTLTVARIVILSLVRFIVDGTLRKRRVAMLEHDVPRIDDGSTLVSAQTEFVV